RGRQRGLGGAVRGGLGRRGGRAGFGTGGAGVVLRRSQPSKFLRHPGFFIARRPGCITGNAPRASEPLIAARSLLLLNGRTVVEATPAVVPIFEMSKQCA